MVRPGRVHPPDMNSPTSGPVSTSSSQRSSSACVNGADGSAAGRRWPGRSGPPAARPATLAFGIATTPTERLARWRGSVLSGGGRGCVGSVSVSRNRRRSPLKPGVATVTAMAPGEGAPPRGALGLRGGPAISSAGPAAIGRPSDRTAAGHAADHRTGWGDG